MKSPPRHDDAANLGGTRRREHTEKRASPKFTPRPGNDQAANSFIVSCKKYSSAMLEYGRYRTQDEADRVAKLLRWAGAVARVEVAAP